MYTKLAQACEAKPGDLVVAVSAKTEIKGTDAAALVAGQLRLHTRRSAQSNRQDRNGNFSGSPASRSLSGVRTDESVGQRAASFHRHRRRRHRKARDPRRGKCAAKATTSSSMASNSAAAASEFIARTCRSASSKRSASAKNNAPPLRLLPRRADLRHAAARRHRARYRPRRHAPRRRKIDPRSHRLPQNHCRPRPDGRIPSKSTRISSNLTQAS